VTTRNTARNLDVLIVGAGPAGAVLSYLLSREGIPVTLIERHHNFDREFRGEVLMPSGIEPFSQMGLEEQLNAVPHVTLDGVELYANQKHLTTIAFDKELFGKYNPRWVSQPDLLEMLVGECSQFKNFKLIRGARVRELIHDKNRVVGVIVDGDKKQEQLYASIIIGADGRTSRVRSSLGSSFRAVSVPMDIVWLKVPNIKPSSKLSMHVGGGKLLISAPTHDDNLQLGFVIKKGSFKDIRKQGSLALIEAIAQHADPILGNHLREHSAQTKKPFLFSTVADYVDDWTAPGSFLLGDAAHAMSPVGGQGLNLAIRDSIVAANHLIPALAKASNQNKLDEITKKIQAERSTEIETIQKLQSLPPKILFNNTIWTRLLFRIVPLLIKDQVKEIKKIKKGNIFDRFAWGISDVMLSKTDNN
jgi:2-polyprenyl-6-methoxyphenol hydroxylase-like FAD-dependent oxidoreductase